MASTVVIDANILLATAFRQNHTAYAYALISDLQKQGTQLAAPVLQRYEIVSVIRRYVHQNLVLKAEADIILDNLQSYAIEYYVDDTLLKRSLGIAHHFNRPAAYDAQYLAVAERLGCEMWTNDERLYNSVKHELTWLHWLGNYK